MSFPAGTLYPGAGLYPGASEAATQIVDLRTARTAQFVTTGSTGASFERPAVSAAFEQADALIVR